MGSKRLTCVMVVVGCALLGGCAGGFLGLTSSFCDPRTGIEPIRLTPSERAALASLPKRVILKVNEYGADNCGWQP